MDQSIITYFNKETKQGDEKVKDRPSITGEIIKTPSDAKVKK